MKLEETIVMNLSINNEDIFPLLFKDKTLQENLDILNNCNCCKIHKINKPNKFVKWIELEMYHQSIELSNKDINNKLKCKCDCRHRARFICRKIDN
tara:strand:- start:72 stop:359 length:288 start_codon:yes stop_codon:yes gene_type:complete